MIQIIVLLLVVGLIIYLCSILPIDPKFKNLINIVVVIFAILYLLQVTGLFGPFHLAR